MKHTLTLLTALLLAFFVQADDAKISVHADKKLFTLSDMMIGANMEDLHYQMVGGFDSQLIHGESFFEPSPTQFAAKSRIAGFDHCGGSAILEHGELVLNEGTRLTSTTRAVEARVQLKTTDGAGLAICVSPNNSDNKWGWYSGYTAEILSNRVVLTNAERANKHREVASAPVTATDWVALQMRMDDGTVRVVVNGKELIVYRDKHPLPSAQWAIVARGMSRFRGAFEPNPFLKTAGDAISLRWEKVQIGNSAGNFALTTDGAWFTNSPSQTITFTGGDGEWGIDNAGLKRWGINLVAGKPYEGFLRVKAVQPTELWVSLRKADGTLIAEQKLDVNESYQRLAFTLTPSASDEQGRFAITLRKPGSITVGFAFLQPGEWGRFKSLPVRKDLAEALLAQGIRVLRFNGGMIEVPGYRWRNLRGPRDERSPYDGFYDRYCSSGFGPAEAVAFGKAAGLPVIPALNLNESPEDVANFVATCRPQFYQVANESKFDRGYVDKFKLVAEAVWKVAPGITLVTTSTGGRGNELHLELAEFARQHDQRIMFDCHSFGGAAAVEKIAAFADWLKTRAPHASVGILEFNAGAFDFQRGLSHALEMNAAYRCGNVIRAIGTPNVSQPWGIYQTDWKAVLWTQGNIYYTPSKVWFQTAYYVDQMIAKSWAPEAVAAEAPATLDVFAAKTSDGAKLVLRVVNNTGNAQPVSLDWLGVTRSNVSVRVTTLAHADPLDYNTESQPEKIKPVTCKETSPTHVFPPYSFTVMEVPIKP
ncbi:MAG: alpha-L-arabinofuranosidase C-terminal domain-containing protein [bacterium]